MKLIFLGTCSGTEPFPGRKHTSVLVDIGGRLYMFDAGEGCSYTAHNMGLDVTKIQKIFLSHPHMDHVGGLANLLWVIRKMHTKYKKPIDHVIEIFTPSLKTYEGALMILKETEGNYSTDYAVVPRPVSEGVLFENADITVTAMANNHLLPDAGGKRLSFSYLIEAEGKRVVYSGDVKSISELEPWLDCDALLMETGHHVPVEAARYAAERNVKKLIFMHHGMTMMNDTKGQETLVKEAFGDNALISEDEMIIEI